MIIYAIRNKNTKLYLSEGKALSRTNARFSNVPRWFNKSAAAKNALNCWVLGIWRNSIDSYGKQEGPQPPNKKPDDRNKEDLEIVAFKIKEIL